MEIGEERIESREWREERRVRPALVVGIGPWGTRVVAAFARRVSRRAGCLPVVRAVALVAEKADLDPDRLQSAASADVDSNRLRSAASGECLTEVTRVSFPALDEETGLSPDNPVSDRLVAALVAELEQIRRLDAVQATRRAGWEVKGGTGSGVTLVAALDEEGTGRAVVEITRLLGGLSGRDFALRLGLSGVFRVPREARAGTAQAVQDADPSSAESDVPDGPDPRPAGTSPLRHGGSALCDPASGDAAACELAPDEPASDDTPLATLYPHTPAPSHSHRPPLSNLQSPTSNIQHSISTFDEGCYLVDRVNADGLLVAERRAQAELVARWLALRTLTGLQAALERAPFRDVGATFDTFGLAAWEFPLEPLTAHLVRRWQREVVGRLLAQGAGEHDPAAVRAFLERHTHARSPWPPDAPVRFQVSGDVWSSPALGLVRTLRHEIDAAVEAERARLDRLLVRGTEALEALQAEMARDLAAAVDASLDDGGLAETRRLLAALGEAARRRVARLEREAARCCARSEELEERAEETGRALNGLTDRFPPCRLGALVGLILRPWRIPRLWLRYREIGRRAGVYLAYRQSQWLLRVESGERQWRAALCAGLADMVAAEAETVARLGHRLGQLRRGLLPDADPGDEGADVSSAAGETAPERTLAQQLEAAALPVELPDHVYRRATGTGEATPASFLALYGPLSRWAREDCPIDTLGLLLEEHAGEQFAFLAQMRLDELLAHTYGGAELRRRLSALVDAAAPWWACDEAALNDEERAGLRRSVLVGLPDVSSSLLVDLLPRGPRGRPPSVFSTGDRRAVVVVQVIQGMPLEVGPNPPAPFPPREGGESDSPPRDGEGSGRSTGGER